jgi:hypothetical protein
LISPIGVDMGSSAGPNSTPSESRKEIRQLLLQEHIKALAEEGSRSVEPS